MSIKLFNKSAYEAAKSGNKVTKTNIINKLIKEIDGNLLSTMFGCHGRIQVKQSSLKWPANIVIEDFDNSCFITVFNYPNAAEDLAKAIAKSIPLKTKLEKGFFGWEISLSA